LSPADTARLFEESLAAVDAGLKLTQKIGKQIPGFAELAATLIKLWTSRMATFSPKLIGVRIGYHFHRTQRASTGTSIAACHCGVQAGNSHTRYGLRTSVVYQPGVQRWKKKDKLILVFDEFQWLVEKSPELCICATSNPDVQYCRTSST
jgi:hypothetical protein